MILRLITIAIITIQAVACATTKPVEQKPTDIIIWEERKDLTELNLFKLIPSWERDQISCKKAKEQNTIAGWQDYINQYPKGKCKSQALKSIATIKQQQQQASNYLNQAKAKAKTGDVKATKDFLNKANKTISGFVSKSEQAMILKIAQQNGQCLTYTASMGICK